MGLKKIIDNIHKSKNLSLSKSPMKNTEKSETNNNNMMNIIKNSI